MPTEKQRILVVDDDQKLRDLLCRYLNEQGFDVSTAEDGVDMDHKLQGSTPDLIVLDLMMPGEDGLSIARRLRAEGEIPIVILSAKGDEIDRIVGLEVGADDYLAKPFNPRELLARIHSVLRRADKPQVVGAQPAQSDSQLSFGPYCMDLDSYSLTRGEEYIELTSGEFELLRHLASRPNHVMSRDHLLDLLDDGVEGAFDRSIDVRITRIRKKIEADPHHPHYIKTVRGVGYLFTDQE
jgi:DNA-binding response OmpR family regulator